MKKLLLVMFFSGVLSLGKTYAQEILTTVNLDLIQNRLNGDKPLPSEERFYVRGAIPSEVEMVKMTIYPSKKNPNTGYSYFWKAPFGYKELAFQLMVENPLKSNSSYDVQFGFYQKAGKEQVAELRALIEGNLTTYLNTITTVKRGGVHFEDSDVHILSNMKKIVDQGALYFELPNGVQFPGFSDLTRKKLEQRKRLKMSKAKYNTTGLSETDNARSSYAKQYLDELMTIINSEVDQYLSDNLLARVGEKDYRNYSTEKTANSIPINVGYGSFSVKEGLPEREFATSPYVGVSLPLGNRTFSKLMGDMSFSTGLFVSGDMQNSLNEKISGPVLDRPVYVGLGYNLFRFIRLNAGGTFLTTEQTSGARVHSFNPFIGVSAEFRVWVGFGNKK